MAAFKDGDIIAVSGTDFVADVINVGTFGIPRRGISHVGVLASYNHSFLVYESTTAERPACYLQRRVIRGAQAHLLEEYLQFVEGKVWHYPLRRKLYAHEEVRLCRSLDASLGLAYDFKGAFRSGGLLFRTFQALRRGEDLSSLFCSEWAADSLIKTGVMHARSASSWNPNRLVRYLVRKGICEKPRRIR